MLIKKHCFEHLNAHRIWLDVYEDNKRAIRLYKSQGFKTKGLLRDAIKENGQYRSLKIMSILANDLEKANPFQIDHLCLIVRNINETSELLQMLFNFEIKLKHNDNDTLMCENKHMHFFIKQMELPNEFLCEQHISLKVDHLKTITNILKTNSIDYKAGGFKGFKYNNYKWVEWRAMKIIYDLNA